MPDLRILIAAENASARFGGEAFLPLHYFRLLRKRNIEVFLLCHSRVRDELLHELPEESSRMFFVEDMAIQKAVWQARQRFSKIPHLGITGPFIYYCTQFAQRELAKRIVREKSIDIVHQPIPVSPKLPSALWDLGAPVIIGPMNGGMSYPSAFADRQAKSERHFVQLGRLVSNLANQLVPGKRKASLLIVANDRTRQALPSCLSAVPVLEMVENGVDLQRFAGMGGRSSSSPTRFAFVGRLVAWKAVDILLHALRRACSRAPMTLEIFGDGEERRGLEKMAAELGIGAQVKFHGSTAQALLPDQLRNCDALVLPSLLECGGAVVLEAMALGLPVIATRWGGPADYVDSETGILVEPSSPHAFTEGLCEALIRLAQDEALRRRMGVAGRAKVQREYDWERKIDQILEIYGRVIAEKAA